MEVNKGFPQWEETAKQLRLGFGYSDATITRTQYTYNVFISTYCSLEDGDTPEEILLQGIDRVNLAFERNEISKDKRLRIRRLAFRLLQLVRTGSISWKPAPLYGKIYGNAYNEGLLASFVDAEHTGQRHAASIIYRDENIRRKSENGSAA